MKLTTVRMGLTLAAGLTVGLAGRTALATCSASDCAVALVDAACQPLEGVVDLASDLPLGIAGTCESCCSGDWQCQTGWGDYYESDADCASDLGRKIPPSCGEEPLDRYSTVSLRRLADDGSDTPVEGELIDHPSCPGTLAFSGPLEVGSYRLSVAFQEQRIFEVIDSTGTAGSQPGGCAIGGAGDGAPTLIFALLALLALAARPGRTPSA